MIPTTPREDGRKAFAAGILLASNPHKTGTEPHEEWARGWSAAKWAAGVVDRVEVGIKFRPGGLDGLTRPAGYLEQLLRDGRRA
jgi:hypothetical protein